MKRTLAPFVFSQFANVASVISGSMVFIAVPWIALEITGNAASAGLVVAATAIPGLLMAPVIGSIIDRFGRRRVAILAELLTVLVSLLIPLVSTFWELTLPALIVIGILRAITAPGGGTARKSLVPDVAAPAKITLDRANSIHEGLFAAGFAVGPALSTFCIAWFGISNTFLVVAFFGLVSAVSAFLIRVTEQHEEKDESDSGSFFRYAIQGFVILFSNKPVLMVMVTIMTLAVIYLPTEMVILPAYYNALNDPGGLGIAVSAAAAASVIGSLGFEQIHKRISYANILRIAIIGIGLSMLPMSQLPEQWVLVTFFFLLGLAWGPLLPLLNTVIQTRIPANKRGRVFALEMTIWNAGPLISMVAVGNAVDAFGVRGVYTVLAVGVCIAAGFVATSKHLKELNT